MVKQVALPGTRQTADLGPGPADMGPTGSVRPADGYTEVWREALHALGRRKRMMAAVLVVTVVTTYGLLQLVTETYEAKAQLLVKLGRENVEVPVSVEKGGVITSGVRKEEINSGVLLLGSRDLLAATVDEIGPAAFRPAAAPATTIAQRVRQHLKSVVQEVRTLVDEMLIALNLGKRMDERDRIILGLERALRVSREGESDVIAASLRLPDPALAVRVVDTLIRHYLERHVAVRRQGDLGGLFDEQAAAYGRRLEELERERQSTLGEFALTAIDEERRLLLGRLDEINRLVDVASREREMIAGGGRPASDGIAAKPSFQPLLDRSAALQIERAKLLRDYDAQSRPLADIAKEMTELESMMLARFDAETRALEQQATAINQRLGRINEGERRLVRIEREYDLAKRHYITYSQRVADTRIAAEFDARRVANVSILSRATHSIEPAYPPKARIMIATIPVGLLLGIGLALLLEHLNDSVRSARDLESLDGIAFLGTFTRGRVVT